MGLDAFVRCNCRQEDKLKPFPLADYAGYVGFDAEGYPYLDLPQEGNRSVFDAFERWSETMCEHGDMTYTAVYLANWTGYRKFRQALAQIGWAFFPTMLRELPESNSGQMLATDASQMLTELAYFKTRADFGTNYFLINSETGQVVQEYIGDYQGVFMWGDSGQLELGVDEEGFFISRKDDGVRRDVFRSNRFEQRVLEKNANGVVRRVEYYDADTEDRFACDSVVHIYDTDSDGKLQPIFPRLLHSEERTIGAEKFDYIVKPLLTICRASVETGNPVVWT